MSKVMRLQASLEAIDFQHGQLLFRELEEAFKKMRENDDYSDAAFKRAGVSKIIKKHTNILTTVKEDSEFPGANAYVYPPQIDVNHPLVNDYWRHRGANRDGLRAIKLAGRAVEGEVDLKESRVSGAFTKIPIDIFLTRALLIDRRYTAAELAAILLHELGHVFTYFEFLPHAVTTNQVLQAVSAAVLATDDRKLKIQLITEGEKALGVKLEKREDLADAKNESTIQVVFLESVVNKSRSSTDSNYYDLSSWEFLSDQFATRHGAGRDLATALNKMQKSWHSPSHISTPTFLILECLKAVLVTTALFSGFATGAALTVLIIGFATAGARDYDDPEARTKRIRNQLVEALKDRKLNKGVAERLLKDLEAIDAVMEQLNDKVTLVEFIWRNILPRNRRSVRQLKMQQELEQLASNALFEKAANFKLNA